MLRLKMTDKRERTKPCKMNFNGKIAEEASIIKLRLNLNKLLKHVLFLALQLSNSVNKEVYSLPFIKTR